MSEHENDEMENYPDYDCMDDDTSIEECALGHDGQYGHAGSEHCDFDCPYRDSEDFVGSEAWIKKHGAA